MSGRRQDRGASAQPARKVLIIVENLSVPPDRRVWLEAKTLEAAGYQVSIICPRGEAQESFEIIDGIHIFRYRMPSFSSGMFGYIGEYVYAWLATCFLSLRVWRRRGFDVVQACNPPDMFFTLGWFYRLLGKRFVYDQHDLCPELYLARFGKKDWLYRALLFMERRTYGSAAAVLATNESFKEISVKRGRLSPERVFVVRNGPEAEKIEPPPAPVGRQTHFTLCYSGIIGPQDGVDYLLRAMAHLVKKKGRQDVELLIVGDGDVLGDMKLMAQALGLDKHVVFTGWISDRQRFKELIRSADVCVSPEPLNPMNEKSTFVKIMDYMSLQKPIVAFDLPETRNSAGGAALYARPNDIIDFASKIGELLDDENMRQALGKLGARRIREGLSWEHSQIPLLEAYTRVFQTRSSS